MAAHRPGHDDTKNNLIHCVRASDGFEDYPINDDSSQVSYYSSLEVHMQEKVLSVCGNRRPRIQASVGEESERARKEQEDEEYYRRIEEEEECKEKEAEEAYQKKKAAAKAEEARKEAEAMAMADEEMERAEREAEAAKYEEVLRVNPSVTPSTFAMPPQRTIPLAKAVKIERNQEENQERLVDGHASKSIAV